MAGLPVSSIQYQQPPARLVARIDPVLLPDGPAAMASRCHLTALTRVLAEQFAGNIVSLPTSIDHLGVQRRDTCIP